MVNYLKQNATGDQQEYMFFVYVDNQDEQVYFIMEDEISIFAKDIYNPIYVSFTGVAVKAATPDEAVKKYKKNDVFSSDEPIETLEKEDVTEIETDIPNIIKAQLLVIVLNIMKNKAVERLSLEGLAKAWAEDSSLTKQEALSFLEIEVEGLLNDEFGQ
jgi:hypothetical protein